MERLLVAREGTVGQYRYYTVDFLLYNKENNCIRHNSIQSILRFHHRKFRSLNNPDRRFRVLE